MKRLLAVIFLMVFLTGCGGQIKTPVSDGTEGKQLSAELAPDAYQSAIPDDQIPLVEVPEKEPEEVVEQPEAVPEEAVPEKKPEPVVEKAPDKALAEQAAAAYVEITKDLEFTVTVEDAAGAETVLEITPENAFNVTGLDRTFVWTYDWYKASEADWQMQMASPERGVLLRMTAEQTSFACCSGGDVMEVVSGGEKIYLKAVNPRQGEPLEKNLYGALIMIAEDAVNAQVWQVMAEGEMDSTEAAAFLAEQVAENYRSVPEWVIWKPLDVQAGYTHVYDEYYGEPQQFCCGMNFGVKFTDFQSLNVMYWQAGAGLNDADEEGYYSWGCGVCVTKNEEGQWVFSDRGTGGVFVQPTVEWEVATVEQLVEVFCLTKGNTHEYLAPNYILQRSGEELAAMPDILDQLTMEEATELCGVLGRCLREYNYWEWTEESLAPVLGDYGDLLHA